MLAATPLEKSPNKSAKFETISCFATFEKSPIKVPNLKPLGVLPPSHEHVKGFLSKCTVLKIDFVVWKRVCVHFSARIFYRLRQ